MKIVRQMKDNVNPTFDFSSEPCLGYRCLIILDVSLGRTQKLTANYNSQNYNAHTLSPKDYP
jgi:hypothetical protein